MARTYKATRTLESRREHFGRALPQDARQERQSARQALRALQTRLDNSVTLWQFYVGKQASQRKQINDSTMASNMQGRTGQEVA